MATKRLPLPEDELRRSPFMQDLLAYQRSPIKQAQREIVLDFILSHHGPRAPRVFTFPGITWDFERQLLDRSPRAAFVSVEHVWGVMERGRPWMPGSPARDWRLAMRAGDLFGFANDRCTWVYSQASHLVRLIRRDIGTKLARRQFHGVLKRNTAAWLDVNHVVDAPLETLCSYFPRFICRHQKVAPLVVTFNAERREESWESRVELVRRALDGSNFRSFELCRAWTYLGRGGHLVGNLAGLSIVRNDATY